MGVVNKQRTCTTILCPLNKITLAVKLKKSNEILAQRPNDKKVVKRRNPHKIISLSDISLTSFNIISRGVNSILQNKCV